MKNLTLLFLLVAFAGLQLQAQDRPSPAAKATATSKDLTVTITYSQPAVKGRTVWGMLVPYNKVWRTGANEATIFEVNTDVVIAGQNLPKGKYALFTIPGEKEWTVIFNKEAQQWGAYNYKEKEDALRITVAPTKTEDMAERLSFDAKEKGANEATVTFQWEKLAFSFDVKAAK